MTSQPAYVYLAIAIIAEVIGTSALKASNAFTHLAPSAIVVVGYSVAFYFLSLALRAIPVGIAYAIWSGLGIVLLVLVGAVAYRQVPDAAALLGIALIIAGVMVLHLFSSSGVH